MTMLSAGLILEVIVEMILSAFKAEKANAHAALFDKMKKVLRHFLGPHYLGFQFHLVVSDLECDFDPGIGRADVRGFDEHSGAGDVLGKGHPGCLVDAKVDRKTFFESCDIPFVGHYVLQRYNKIKFDPKS
jgi:hypothetical protein